MKIEKVAICGARKKKMYAGLRNKCLKYPNNLKCVMSDECSVMIMKNFTLQLKIHLVIADDTISYEYN